MIEEGDIVVVSSSAHCDQIIPYPAVVLQVYPSDFGISTKKEARAMVEFFNWTECRELYYISDVSLHLPLGELT